MLIDILISLWSMSWAIFWPLAMGFMLSALLRAFVSTDAITQRLGKTSVKSLGTATVMGAMSSSCSYAAASLMRSLLLKGSSLANAIAFLVASTNLVFEIFVVLLSLLGVAFVLGELFGGLLLIAACALLLTFVIPSSAWQELNDRIKKDSMNQSPSMQHSHSAETKIPEHKCGAAMMPKTQSAWKKASSHFHMDVSMVGKDIAIGVLIAAVLMVVVPKSAWQTLFLSNQADLPQFIILLWNALAGALIALISFVCSVGNIVLAAALWHGGISFGGVMAFVLSDLITLPMLSVYRRYYGLKSMLCLFATLLVGIVFTGLALDYSFEALGWLPESPIDSLHLTSFTFEWNTHTFLNLIFIPISIVFYWMGKRVNREM